MRASQKVLMLYVCTAMMFWIVAAAFWSSLPIAHCGVQEVASRAADILFWGVQYHPELYFSQIADHLERRDVEGFSPIKQLAGLSLAAGQSATDIATDFHLLDKEGDVQGLKERYAISHALTGRNIHERELSNWLASIKG